MKETDKTFTQEIDTYIVLKLLISNYEPSRRELTPESEMVHSGLESEIREDEMRLLKQYFRQWERPYYGRLPGWREDSPVFLLWNGQLACGVYLCNRNEFDAAGDWGQLHYAFVDPIHQGKGLYSVVFREAIKKAEEWGLGGLYLNSDRYMLPEVYERWGATYWRTIKKTQGTRYSLLQRLFRRLSW